MPTGVRTKDGCREGLEGRAWQRRERIARERRHKDVPAGKRSTDGCSPKHAVLLRQSKKGGGSASRIPAPESFTTVAAFRPWRASGRACAMR